MPDQTSISNSLVEMIIVTGSNFIPLIISRENMEASADVLCKELEKGSGFFKFISLTGTAGVRLENVHGFYFREYVGNKLQQQMVDSIKKIADEHSEGDDWKK